MSPSGRYPERLGARSASPSAVHGGQQRALRGIGVPAIARPGAALAVIAFAAAAGMLFATADGVLMEHDRVDVDMAVHVLASPRGTARSGAQRRRRLARRAEGLDGVSLATPVPTSSGPPWRGGASARPAASRR